MNWKRYGIFSIFFFILYVVYKAFSYTLDFIIVGARNGLGASLAIMLIDNANDDMSDGGKIYAVSEWYRNN